MSTFDALPDSWVVWSDQGGPTVLAYRPDVFDGAELPAECMPTLYVSHGRRNRRRPGSEGITTETDWYVTLFLEPEVSRDAEPYPSREAAVEGAIDLARAFDSGEIDYRGLYQVPRDRYFERLDELIGADEGGHEE